MMRSFIYTLLIFCCITGIYSCEEKGTAVIVEGKAPEGVVKMCLMQSDGMMRSVAESPVDSMGKYHLAYDVASHPEEYYLTDGGMGYIPLYAVPGDRIRVNFLNGEVLIDGDGKENNLFLQEMQKKQREFRKQFPADIKSPALQKESAIKMTEALLAYIDGAGIEDKEFMGTVKASVLKNKYYSLVNYPGIYRMIFGEEAEIEPDYYDFLREMDFSSPYWINVNGINAFLRDLFRVMETQGYLVSGLEDYLLKQAERIGDARLRESYLLYALNLEFYGFNQQFDSLMASVSPFIISEEGKSILLALQERNRQKLVEYNRFKTGNPAFNFAGRDKEGKKHSLEEWKGKILVVDVWNTGCKPCIAEIPFMKELEKRFEGQEVVFVSYSLDTDENVWKNFMLMKGMEGKQLIDTLGFKSEVVKNFALTGIPRFMVFGRDGEIVDVFAPRPSDPRLALLIEKSLGR